MSAGGFSVADDRYVLRLATEERLLLGRLLEELRSLLSAPPDSPGAAATARLFPVAHPDDAEMEAEYQRLMRDELVSSRLAGIDAVEAVLAAATTEGRRGKRAEVVTFDENGLMSFMQAVNGIRLVLGTVLDITDDDDEQGNHGEDDSSVLVPEYQLYAYLSWLLDSAVSTLSPGTVM